MRKNVDLEKEFIQYNGVEKDQTKVNNIVFEMLTNIRTMCVATAVSRKDKDKNV
jgi:hypothetical protein